MQKVFPSNHSVSQSGLRCTKFLLIPERVYEDKRRNARNSLAVYVHTLQQHHMREKKFTEIKNKKINTKYNKGMRFAV
jgi:hypothetical protein